MPGFHLDEEQRARVRDCLQKDSLALQGAVFERLLLDIEYSISQFHGIAPGAGGVREAHDALRAIWLLAHEDDPPVRVLRRRIKALPKLAIEYIDRRAPRVIQKLFPEDSFEDGAFLAWGEPGKAFKRGGFLAWADKASGNRLVKVLRVLTAEGGNPVAGRSRGVGRRSGPRLEPMIFGEARGAGAKWHKGGRPSEDARHELVMHLAMDWLHATGQMPRPGRSDETGFGSLVHSVFQWLYVPEAAPHEEIDKASYSLRRYWVEVEQGRTRPSLEDFLRRRGEEL